MQYSLQVSESKLMSALNRIPYEEVLAAAHTLWSNEAVANKVAVETVEIINRTYKRKFAFFNGKSSKCIVGGLFYILGYRYNAVKKQRELADHLGTSDVTIRASYRQWLEVFPDLFLDVIGKFAEDNTLRYFVLLNHKQGTFGSSTRKAN